jgi:Toprim domain
MNARAPLPYEPQEIRERLQGRLHDLLPKLGIDDRLRGRVLLTSNPRRADNRRKGNFAIWLSGDGAGSFKDYGLAGDVRGDVFQLIQYLARLNSWIDSYWWALDFLNLQRGQVRSAEQAKVDRERVEAERRSREMKHQAEDRARSRALFGSWLKLPESIADTPVERYLREARGIPMERLGSPKFRLGALRYAVRLEHIDGETGEVTYWPAMVAAMTAGLTVTGLHRTWLAPDGRGKALVNMPKKMVGRTAGAAIRLTPGPSGLAPTRAAQKGIVGPLAVGEGIETSLTVAAAMPEWRVWAAGSVSHMGLIEWPACADRVILLRDNDWKPAAREAFEKQVLENWRRQARGRTVDVIQSEVGNDFNDWLKGAA